jgi:hypothetical protein
VPEVPNDRAEVKTKTKTKTRAKTRAKAKAKAKTKTISARLAASIYCTGGLFEAHRQTVRRVQQIGDL